MPAERLQKIIAAAGIASRRKSEELITQGRVTVNGQTITELGSKADPEHDHIKVDGKLLRGPQRHTYLLLNKPKGYVTTVSDPEGRPTVLDLVKHVGERIYPVGRLDFGSEGLLLLTNDGELANFLTRAASHVQKTYLVKVAGVPAQEEIEKLRHGIRIGSKPGMRGMHAVRTAPAQIKIVREAENPWYEVTLTEGKNRQIRRMFEEIGHHVEKIKRVRYGSLALDVEPGEFRELRPHEVAALKKAGGAPLPRQTEQRDFKASMRYLGKPRPERRGSSQERPGKSEERSAFARDTKRQGPAKQERAARDVRESRSEQQRFTRAGATKRQQPAKQERAARDVRASQSEHSQQRFTRKARAERSQRPQRQERAHGRHRPK